MVSRKLPLLLDGFQIQFVGIIRVGFQLVKFQDILVSHDLLMLMACDGVSL